MQKTLEKKRKGPSESDIKEVITKKVKPNPKNKDNKPDTTNVPNKNKSVHKLKETKLANGFVVETLSNTTTPSLTDKISNDNNPVNTVEPKERSKRNERKKKIKDKRKLNKEQNKLLPQTNKKTVNPKTKLKKTKLGEENTQTSDLTPEDMLTWAEFKLQEPIVKALMELGFKKPTKIQQLTLPAAIHGDYQSSDPLASSRLNSTE